MQFRTPIPISESIFPIDYNSKIMSVGSCFAVNMAEKFNDFKFQNNCNPFGIIFNPVSIERLVERIVNKELFTESDIFFHNDLWHCFEVHSELSNPSKEAFLDSLNQLLDSTNQQIFDLTHFQITYGTAWVYRNIESKQIVANCHKVPQKQFAKELLAIETIQTAIQNTFSLIHSINPEAKFTFTVSPVRHIKDGFVENTLSKAHLISAVHSAHNSQPITYNYFPSYEIMMDELRDYRFYAEDMLHPSQVAIDYIWQRFKETSISKTAFAIMDEVEGIQKGLSHRPFNPQSESHQKFIAKLQIRITKLHSEYPFMKF
ncbi:GSCFA domain-containing protein [Flavobacterium undicola]|uniref:GSCFA domain-containing protein n=1 Tax=Flavobacterium undicola TaxID=1932779 RepID=UPI0013789E66|nr:GSCFA domain-containing protein [Flavobacterium undicola]MBA0884595.1 GSCFA domain-containing protein [Flavobacterium undicola]